MRPLGFSLFSALLLIIVFQHVDNKFIYLNDICGHNNGRKIYLEYNETGTLTANFENNLVASRNEVGKNVTDRHEKCTVEVITCPSCSVDINFRFLNISRNCGKTPVFDSCGCDFVWIYEPPFEEVSGEQFCGHFITNNATSLNYISQTRTVAVAFLYSSEYGHAFTLDYTSQRNRFFFTGTPTYGNMNNVSQTVLSPFFPSYYPSDLSVEYVINCESVEKCRISLVFTDFQIALSSIIEFFDWNGQRMYVTSGNVFRPPVIISSGPTLVIRFYANGASHYGFKAAYTFILGDLNDVAFKPDIDCGGYVNNLGGGITMMNMITEGNKFYDCIWIVKLPSTFSHMKTHLYVKVITFVDFAGNTELTIKQGLTSNEPSVEVLRHPKSNFFTTKEKEHVVPLPQGFYISLRGLFRPESRLAIVYAAFNYKDCFAGSDFLCHNLRCISTLLNCDGFDHCGDNSDESPSCSEDPKDRRQWSKRPNFLFPKMDHYTDLTTATLIFLMCSFGLIGVIFAMSLLLYRVNVKARHQRQIQDHIQTIHAILEEGVSEVEEEIIIPDDPPDYEAPPDYNDVLKAAKYLKKTCNKLQINRCSKCNIPRSSQNSVASRSTAISEPVSDLFDQASTSRSYQTTPSKIPSSPPPSYNSDSTSISSDKEPKVIDSRDNIDRVIEDETQTINSPLVEELNVIMNINQTSSSDLSDNPHPYKFVSDIGQSLRKSIRNYASSILGRNTRKRMSLSEVNLVKYFSDSELVCSSYLNIDSRLVSNGNVHLNRFRRSFSTDDICSIL